MSIPSFALRRLLPLGLLLGALGAALFAAGIGGARDAVAQAEPGVLPVETLAIEPVHTYLRTRTFTGRLQARQGTELGFERAGKLVSLAVREGQQVDAGEALAELDRRRLETRRLQLEAQLARARAQLDEMRAGPRAETIAAARARVRALEATVSLARKKQTRRHELLAEGVITQEELDEAGSQLEAEEARRDAAQRALDELLAGTRVEQVRAQEALVAQLEAQLADLAIELDDSVLRAPFAGTIGPVGRDVGAVLAPGEPLLRLVETGVLEAWVGVPPGVAAGLKPGSQATLRLDGAPFPARVSGVLPELDRLTRTVTVVLELDAGQRPELVPERVVRLEVPEELAVEGAWLPLSALSRGERELWSCLALAQDEAGGYLLERRRVEILHTEAERALVASSLAPETLVVAAGTHRVVPGQRVEPLADAR